MLKSVPNVIHSTQVSRKLQQHADVLISLIKNTASNNLPVWVQDIERGVEVEKSQPFS